MTLAAFVSGLTAMGAAGAVADVSDIALVAPDPAVAIFWPPPSPAVGLAAVLALGLQADQHDHRLVQRIRLRQPDRRRRAYKIADNRIAELAGWDLPELAIEPNDLIDIDFNMDSIGFEAPVINFVIGEASKEVKPDAADAVPEVAVGPPLSRSGDLWLLGPHKVACGSALDAEVMQILMGADKARMVLTDAPYNVPISGFVGGRGKVKHREFAMVSGEMSSQDFLAFLTQASALAAARLVEGGLLYGFMDWRGLATYLAALDACALSQINLCVWNKGTGGMGSLYRSQHELCLVYKKGGAPHLNNVELGQNGRYRTNVWDHPGMASFGRGRDEALKLHPTVKPATLLIEAIKDVTRQKDIVLDTFLGSGSTLIAAHQCGRICRGIEIDPIYVDTIIRRFEAVCGIEATHTLTGKTFAEMRQCGPTRSKRRRSRRPPRTCRTRCRACGFVAVRGWRDGYCRRRHQAAGGRTWLRRLTSRRAPPAGRSCCRVHPSAEPSPAGWRAGVRGGIAPDARAAGRICCHCASRRRGGGGRSGGRSRPVAAGSG